MNQNNHEARPGQPLFDRREFLIAAGALISAGGAGLAGCGGGSRGSGGFRNKPVETGRRIAAANAVSAKFATLPGTDTTADATQIAAFMAAMPEFEATGVSSDDSAWGRFTDGRLLLVVNNRAAERDRSSAAIAPARSTRAAAAGLPAQTTVHLYDTMGSWYRHPIEAIQPALAARGYLPTGEAIQKGTVDELMQVQGDGIFYLDAHGGIGEWRTGGPVFTIWTGTNVSDPLEIKYEKELNAQRLVWTIAASDAAPENPSQPVYPVRYAITASFVAEHMKFGPNSLVFVNACTSDESGFKNACLGAGAGVYLGWTLPVADRYSSDTTLFLFDRLLGNNTVAPVESPSKAPLDWQELKTAMATTINPVTSRPYDRSPYKNNTVSYLIFTPGNGDLGAIVPIIRTAITDRAKNELTLTGVFGATRDSVSADGVPLTIKTWTPSTIVTAAPNPAAKTVFVTVTGRTSNPHAINSLQISPLTATYTPGSRVTFTVTMPSGVTGDVVYQWSQTSPFGTLSSSDGHAGNSIETNSANVTVDLVTTPSDQSTIMVSVSAFSKDASGIKALVGMAQAVITPTDGAPGTVTFRKYVLDMKPDGDHDYALYGFWIFKPVSGAKTYEILGPGGVGEIDASVLEQPVPVFDATNWLNYQAVGGKVAINDDRYPGTGTIPRGTPWVNLGGGEIGVLWWSSFYNGYPGGIQTTAADPNFTSLLPKAIAELESEAAIFQQQPLLKIT